ncbi:ABC transporter ATP-binding protein [Rhizobiales bacterium TNE-4]|nr:ABC transporter ATP-binding protein [Rhizobiales bacterium TNE-4]MBV1827504.1 ABC transporter ATP-binding protein [Rhizobiales bacterium TNE-4]
MSEPLLSVYGLKTNFDTRHGLLRAVDDVSFSLDRGEILGLVGESGSGKSVTGFSLLGLIEAPGRIAGGSIRFDGQELVGASIDILRSIRGRRIAMIFQDPAMTLNPVLTIRQQMKLAYDAHQSGNTGDFTARALEVLSKVGIPDPAARIDAYPHQFSGGMRQRVAIAIALMHRPDIIIADEPTTALDVSIQAQILAEMRGLAQETGTALIWISHDLATIAALANRIAVMYAGRIVEQGTTAALIRAPRHPYTQGLLNSRPDRFPPKAKLPQIRGAMPSLSNLPQGCAFAPRCQFATDLCRSAIPPWSGTLHDGFACYHPLERTP